MSNSEEDNLVHVADIGRPFGVRGEVHLHLHTDRPEEILSTPGKYRLLDGREINVRALKQRGEKWMWELETAERDLRGYAAKFTNSTVVIPEDEMPERDGDELSEYQLAGMEVVDTEGESKGVIDRIDDRYEVGTWIVRAPDGSESEFPAIDEYIVDVDAQRRVVTIYPDVLIK